MSNSSLPRLRDTLSTPEIDIEALAEKVYRLMLAEIRLDRARGLASDQGG